MSRRLDERPPEVPSNLNYPMVLLGYDPVVILHTALTTDTIRLHSDTAAIVWLLGGLTG